MPANQTQNPYLPYIQSLLKAADLESLLQGEDRDNYIQQLSQEMEKKVSLMIMSELTRPQFDQYIKMVSEKKNQEELQTFLKEKIPDFDQKTQQELKNFAESFIKNSLKLKT